MHLNAFHALCVQAGVAKQTLEGALLLLVSNKALHKKCAAVVAQLLMQLQHLKVGNVGGHVEIKYPVQMSWRPSTEH